ncbi:MAG: hypothetical protein IPL33_13185 [Sphingobacteriales bacterium]|nr:hypothetical protein [Sphingobacteriales bacterium]MCC7224626.1 hypothetical protein [Chitinophagales bacterium]
MSAFRQAKRYDTALQLADLVIARECQKVATRQWYRNRHNTHQLPDGANTSPLDDEADRW